MDGLERGLEDCLSPADGAVVAVETEQYPFSLVLEGADREDPVVPDDRRGVSGCGDGGLPGDVFTRLPVPFDRHAFFIAGSVSAWSAPGLPVIGAGTLVID